MPRWVAAVWLVRILDGTDPSPRSSRFADVTGNPWWEPHVERLAELGATVGCRTNPLRFCPDRKVNRAQMASFLTRAFNMPASPDAGFTDVDATNTHYDNINALFASGVTVGCRTSPLQYCPARATTRAQMATFLWRAIQDETERQIRIEWRPVDRWDVIRLARSGVLCEPVVLDGLRCWTLHYTFAGDWSPPPRLVECLTNGEPSLVGPSEFWWDPDDGTVVGCIYLEHVAWAKQPTGTAQVVVDGIESNILPSKGG